jgi:hypothetical protein
MVNQHNRGGVPRPLEHLHAASRLYPNAWKQIDIFRRDRGKDLPDWPDWCFLPMAAWYSIVSADAGVNHLTLDLIPDVARLAALGAWRYTQGIYRIDDDLRVALIDTVPSGALPVEALYRLPEWSLYIETPDKTWHGDTMHGFWAHLERDMNTKRDELRLLIDSEQQLIPAVIHLGPWTITEAVDRSITESKRQAGLAGIVSTTIPGAFTEIQASEIYPLISLLLYVISNGVDWPDSDRPNRPSPKRTKRGWSLFPAEKPHVWKLGENTGRILRQAANQETNGGKKSPHIRRAHWHHFWKGPRSGEQELIVRWLSPIIVAPGADE